MPVTPGIVIASTAAHFISEVGSEDQNGPECL